MVFVLLVIEALSASERRLPGACAFYRTLGIGSAVFGRWACWACQIFGQLAVGCVGADWPGRLWCGGGGFGRFFGRVGHFVVF